jgi:aminoglycoside phosphotransferase family enzyme/predicted kinase
VIGVDQNEVVGFLRQALAEDGREPAIIETHISILFLTTDRVYKLKRSVRLDYLDFSTPALRLAACEAEVRLNRRTAADLYLGVSRLTREADGLRLGGGGQLVEPLVEMRRFSADGLFDVLARAQRLNAGLMWTLSERIAAFHAAAETDYGRGGAEGIARVLSINEAAMRQAGPLQGPQLEPMISQFRRQFVTLQTVLESRRAAGKVRWCHGDLHLGNICLFNGVPTLFDCLEFSQDLATIDVFYDIGFLLMDLWERKLFDLANVALNGYLEASGDIEGLQPLPFFMAVRAAVRAHVLSAQTKAGVGDAAAMAGEAVKYLGLAGDLLAPARPRLVAIGGLSGSGKSTLARSLAACLAPAPGALILSSDRIRKRLFGVEPQARLPAEAYRREVSGEVYAQARALAARGLAAGHSIIAEAVFDRLPDRQAIADTAQRAGVRFDGLWLEAPADLLLERVGARRDDPSDATQAVVASQLRGQTGTIDWVRLDATLAPGRSRAAALTALGLALEG